MKDTTRFKDMPRWKRFAIAVLIFALHIGAAWVLSWLIPALSFRDVVLFQALWIAIVAGLKVQDL